MLNEEQKKNKKLAKEFERQFECLGENAEGYKTLSVPIGKETQKDDKYNNDNIITIFDKTKFFDNARFMPSLLSTFVNNLAEGTHKIKCKDCDCFLEYESIKDNLIKYKCLFSKKDFSNQID